MTFITDLRHAVRLLGRSPVFSLTSVLSLSLGIAAAASIFSLTDALLFEPPAGVRSPSTVVEVGRSSPGSGLDNTMSHPAFNYLRAHAQSMVGLAATEFAGRPMNLGMDGGSERVMGTLVSANYFDVLGTRPAIGRFFRPEEDEVPGEHPVVVLSHAFWMRRFGGDPGVLDRPFRLNNSAFTVVGVAEPGFQGSSMIGTEVWVPMAMIAVAHGRANADILTDPRLVWHVAIARLGPAVTAAQAHAELNTLMEAFKAQEPRANSEHRIRIQPLGRVPGPVRSPVLAFVGLLFALTAALLAIACSNVAGMLLARAAVRRREMATRLAMGASRERLIGQLLTETIVLSLAAGTFALPLTYGFVAALERSLPALPVIVNLDLRVDLLVTAFAFTVALFTGVIFGLAPARHALGTDLAPMLHGAYATTDRRHFRVRNVLVAAQVALSLTLVVTALLFLRSLEAAARTHPGFETADILIASVDVSLAGYRDQQAVALADRITGRLRAMSGVTSVATGRMIPLQGGFLDLGDVRVPGAPGPSRGGHWDADWNIVSTDYFQTIGMPIVAGRPFQGDDREGSRHVAIVNETFARRAFPGQSAVGRVFYQQLNEQDERPLEIVGIARDAKYRFISDSPRSFIYRPLAQQPTSRLEFYVKHEPDLQLAADVRMAMNEVEPDVPLILLQSFDDAVAVGLLPQRLAAWVAGGVGTVGIFLAALGLYGLMAFVVTQRTREIAIRMALGASHGNVRGLVLKQAARLSALGAAVGLMMAGVVGALAQSMLVGVPPLDPIAFGGTALLFAIVLAIAAWTPAHRAATTDPATALRSE
jgi:predicted permease